MGPPAATIRLPPTCVIMMPPVVPPVGIQNQSWLVVCPYRDPRQRAFPLGAAECIGVFFNEFFQLFQTFVMLTALDQYISCVKLGTTGRKF